MERSVVGAARTVPELLAPAGGPDALRAAVAAGADAVYLGLGTLNARAANSGFTLEELRCGSTLAHAHGARVYVTLNVYVHDDELDGAVALARKAVTAGADAFIVADAGLCLRLRAEIPGVELHLSTQAGVQDANGALLAARELGAARVTCARELRLDELADLCAAGVPVEAFCHGAICICYSGACGFSAIASAYSPSARRSHASVRSALHSGQSDRPGEGEGEGACEHEGDGLRNDAAFLSSRRSANRGDCTQPCRIAHALVDGEGHVLAGGSDAPAGDRLLCPRDNCSIRHIPELVRAGVSALKIEGRMKNPDYVFNVVRCYRAALDAVAAGRELGTDELDALEAQLARSFNRGFTDAYLRGGSGSELMSTERAINQGLCVGKVVARCYQEVTVAFERAVHAGDTLEIRSTPGPDAAPDVPKRWPMVPCPADAPAGGELAVPCKRKVEVGSAVHVVRSVDMLGAAADAVAAMAAEEDRLCAEAACPAHKASSVSASASDPAPTYASACKPCADVHKTAVLDRRAPASAGFVEEGDPGATACYGRLVTMPDEAARLLAGQDHGVPADVCVPAYALLEDPSAWEALLDRLTVILDEVNRAADVSRVRELCFRSAAVVCHNLGQIDLARTAGVPWEAAAPISVWNAETARWLHGLGARRIWLPDELSAGEVAAIARKLVGTVPLGRALTDAPTLMVTEHCLLTAEGPCAGESDPVACASCPRRLASLRGERFLMEADGVRLPVRVDALGRTRIFGPVLHMCQE